MPAANLKPIFEEEPHYTMNELIELRRQMLRYSRSVPPGPERNEHRQVALEAPFQK
jgi:hypothetical protein